MFKKLSQDPEQEEKRLKMQSAELKEKLDALERRYAYGEIYAKFSAELKAELREIEVNLGKLPVLYRTTSVNSFFGLAAEISQKMEQKERGKSSRDTDFSLLVDQ